MDKSERVGDPEVVLRDVLDGFRAEMWTALPGIIQSFDPVAMTCTVQPAIKMRARGPDGAVTSIPLPLLVDCPVQFPSGGNCTLTFPVSHGDECLVVFASRCIDAWWQSSGVQEQAAPRMHDLSDGFALLGTRSRPRALSGVSTTAVQLRSDDGQAFIELNPTTHNINVKTVGNVTESVQGYISSNSPSVIDMSAPVVNAPNAFSVGNGASGTITDINGKVITFQAGICTDIS